MNESEINETILNGDGWDNLIAMKHANKEQGKKHSNRVLEIGTGWDNLIAMEHANKEQRKKHRNRVLEKKF